jgi:hypothetical protein
VLHCPVYSTRSYLEFREPFDNKFGFWEMILKGSKLVGNSVNGIVGKEEAWFLKGVNHIRENSQQEVMTVVV